MKRIERWLVLTSLILGLAETRSFAEPIPQENGAVVLTEKKELPQKTELLAWWGGLYPEFCLDGVVKQVEGESKTPVRIRFKYLTFLNDR